MKTLLRSIVRAWLRLSRQGHWHAHAERGGLFHWRRYDFEADQWVTKPMSDEERDEAYAMWAIK